MGNEIVGEDKLEVYTPDIGDSQPIGIDESTTSYSPRLNSLKEGETIQVKLNEKAIKWRISHDLYKDFKSGVRELFQNEARACRQARDKYGSKPSIEVRLNSTTRQLTIQGIDSLGISESVFDNVLRVLGVSGNTDGGNEVGQFGMGFASYTTISDIILIETWFRENRADGSEQKYAFLGDNGIDFKILPEPELDTYGTKATMTYHSKVEERGIVDMLSECAKFCGVPVKLIVDGTWNTYHEYGQDGIYELDIYNGVKDCLKQQFAEVLKDRNIYTDDLERNYTKDTDVGFYKEVHIDNEDYEFFGIIGVESSKAGYSHKIDGKMNYHLLATVPIEISFTPHGQFTAYALNIKNERKFMPTADRDRLTQEAEEAIQKQYDIEIKSFFTTYKLESIADYLTSLDKTFYEQLYYYEDVFDKDTYENNQQVLNTLNRRFCVGSGRQYRTLKSMIASGSTIIKLKALRGDYMARLATVFDDMICFRYKLSDERGDQDDFDNTIELLKEAGVTMGEEYIKEHKIRPLTRTERKAGNDVVYAEKSVRLVNSGYRPHHEIDGERAYGLALNYRMSKISTTVGKINDNVHDHMIVFNDKPKDKFYDITQRLYSTEAPYVFMRNIKGLDEDITRYTEYCNDIKELEWTLVDGKKIHFKDMKDDTFTYIQAEIEPIIEMTKGKDIKGYHNCIVVENQQQAFDLMTLSTENKIVITSEYEQSVEDIIEKTCDIDTSDINMYCNESQKKIIYGKLPYFQQRLSEGMFKVFLRAVSSKPYDFEVIANEIRGELREQDELQ